MNDPSVDWLVLGVVTFIARLFYGRRPTSSSGSRSGWARRPSRSIRRSGSHASWWPSRRCRWCSLVVLVPAIAIGFGEDWFRAGGDDEGRGRELVGRRRPPVRRVVGRARRAGSPHDVPAAVARRRRRARARGGDGRRVRRRADRAVAPGASGPVGRGSKGVDRADERCELLLGHAVRVDVLGEASLADVGGVHVETASRMIVARSA